MKPYTLRPSLHLTQVFLYQGVVDFRRGHRGLSSLIEHELGHDPFTDTLYVFANRQRNKIKCLFWEENGFVLYYKTLAEERFHWPQENEELVSLNGEQLNWLLNNKCTNLVSNIDPINGKFAL